jgi:hypothetical protein
MRRPGRHAGGKVGLWGSKSKDKSDKMKVFEVKLAGKKPVGNGRKASPKAKASSFSQWIDQVIKGSRQ